MRDQYSFCVVICVHSDERTELSVKAIKSVDLQSLRSTEIIVVADHNPRLAGELARRCPEARVIANRGKRGLSGARNTGWQAARSDIVAFLDDDAEADPNWLRRMAAHYSDSAVIGVGGQVDAVWPGGAPSWFPREFAWVVGCSYTGLPERAAGVRNLIGCNMSFRRDVIALLGGFREGLGREGGNAFGCEETDFCIRATKAFPNARIVYDPAILVRHNISQQRKSFRYFLGRCLAEGRSKAIVVHGNGRQQGLSSERRYALSVLPEGVKAGLADTLRGRVSGLARSASIVAGFLQTAIGYVDFRFLRPSRTNMAESFRSLPILDVDLDAPSSGKPFEATNNDIEHNGVFLLLRSGGRPVASLELPLIRAVEDSPAFRSMLMAHLPACSADPAPVPIDPKRVSVIIATRNRPDQLSRCLTSVLAQNYSNFEIIVVDNAPSDDRTQQLIAERYSGRVHYVRELRPGLAQAHNAGLAHAHHELIAFTDDDVICDPGWLAALVSGFEVGNDVGCVTGLIVPMELETRAQYWTECHGGFGKGFNRQRFDLNSSRGSGRLYPLMAGQFGSGAAMAFRRTALERIGSFDAALGAGTKARGGDDLQGFASLILSGQAIVYEPAAITWHQHRREEAGMTRQAYGYGVGLGAYLASMVIHRPGLIWRIIIGLPEGIAHMAGPRSQKINRLPEGYPRSYIWLERLGILAGPLAYLRSRRSLAEPIVQLEGMGQMQGKTMKGAGRT